MKCDEQSEVPRLTIEERDRALAAMDRAERHAKKLLARRGGNPLRPSLEIIHEMREERDRQLAEAIGRSSVGEGGSVEPAQKA